MNLIFFKGNNTTQQTNVTDDKIYEIPHNEILSAFSTVFIFFILLLIIRRIFISRLHQVIEVRRILIVNENINNSSNENQTPDYSQIIKEELFTTENNTNTSHLSCAICLEDYKDNDNLGKLQCNHKFHYECINNWFSNSNICPLCNTDYQVNIPIESHVLET